MWSCWARQLGGPFAAESSVLRKGTSPSLAGNKGPLGEMLVEWMNKQTSLTYCSLPFGDVGEIGQGLEERVGCDHNFCFQCFPEEICTAVYFRGTWGCRSPRPAPVFMIDKGGPDFPFALLCSPPLLLVRSVPPKQYSSLLSCPTFSDHPSRLSHWASGWPPLFHKLFSKPCGAGLFKPVLSYTQNCSSLFVVWSPQGDCELPQGRFGIWHTIRAEKTYLSSTFVP